MLLILSLSLSLEKMLHYFFISFPYFSPNLCRAQGYQGALSITISGLFSHLFSQY